MKKEYKIEDGWFPRVYKKRDRYFRGYINIKKSRVVFESCNKTVYSAIEVHKKYKLVDEMPKEVFFNVEAYKEPLIHKPASMSSFYDKTQGGFRYTSCNLVVKGEYVTRNKSKITCVDCLDL